MKVVPVKRQRGAAILVAMVTVALVASIAAVATQQQWRMTQVEVAERTRQQALWLLRGALDWSRLVLRQDAQSSGLGSKAVDHLAEPWAVPLQETKLASFLSAQAGVANVDDASADADAAYLAGGMEDVQARLNVLHVVYSSAEQQGAKLLRLFDVLGLPRMEADMLLQGLQQAADVNGGDARPLMPQRLADLRWLGLSPSTLALLQPHVALAPTVYKVNVNTASATVLAATSPALSLQAAQALVDQRNQQHFSSLQQARDLLELSSQALSDEDFAVSSEWFAVRGQVRMEDLVLGMQAQVQRSGSTVTTQQVATQGLSLGGR